MDIEILKKQNKLTISDDGFVYIRPTSKYTYDTFPLENLEGCITLTPNDYVLLKAGYYRLNDELTGLVVKEIQETKTMQEYFAELGNGE